MPDRRHVVTALEPPAEQPAFHAWRRSGLGPDPIRVELLKESWKTLACRLVGCGPAGTDVVATRRATKTTLVERTIYGDVLPGLSTPHLRLLGAMDEPVLDQTWMFLEDGGEVIPDLHDPVHRALAGRWLGRLHVALVGRSFADMLPDRSAEYVHGVLQASRAALLAGLSNEHLDRDGAHLLRAATRRLDVIDAAWPQVVDGLDELPQSLVHGDFVRKNMRLRPGVDGPSIVAFDWEMGGWGVPLVDLGSIDLGAYLSEAGPFWGADSARLERLADLGRMFGLISAIGWEVPYLESPWLHRPMNRIAVYHARLGSVLVRLAPAMRSSNGHRPIGLATANGPEVARLAGTDDVMRGLLSMEPRGPARVVAVLHREPNVYRSTFPSEVATCAFDDGVERQLFIKRYVPGIHDGFGYWRGGPYEGRIYDDVLARLNAGTPRLFGSWSDPATGHTFLALEYVAGLRLDRSEPTCLVHAARWLAALHRDGTPIASAHPSVRAYDEAYFRGWSTRTLRRVGDLRPEATWIEPVIRRFDDEMVPRLLAAEPVFIHGELYPENVIVDGDRLCVVDWQSAAIGPGVIDLASVIEGHWPPDLVRESRDVYARAVSPEGDVARIEDELAAARLYWSMRWLGADEGHPTVDRHIGYLDALKDTAHQLGLLVAAR